jgi:hypothetical protein
MPKDTPQTYTPQELGNSIVQIEEFLGRIKAIHHKIIEAKLESILVTNNAPYDRVELNLQRWSRSVEDAYLAARKKLNGLPPMKPKPKKKTEKK